MLARSAARAVRSALARRAASVAPEVQLVTESAHEAHADAPGRAQVLRAPPGVDAADFARALNALATQHQPLIELPGAPFVWSDAAGVLLLADTRCPWRVAPLRRAAAGYRRLGHRRRWPKRAAAEAQQQAAARALARALAHELGRWKRSCATGASRALASPRVCAHVRRAGAGGRKPEATAARRALASRLIPARGRCAVLQQSRGAFAAARLALASRWSAEARSQVAAYAASRLPCTYAALRRVLSEVRTCTADVSSAR